MIADNQPSILFSKEENETIFYAQLAKVTSFSIKKVAATAFLVGQG